MQSNKQRKEQLVKQLVPQLASAGGRVLREYLLVRIECARDSLEAKESEQTRGALFELRDLMKIFDIPVE